MVIKQRKTILAVLLGLAALTPMPAQAMFRAALKYATTGAKYATTGALGIAAYLGYKSAPTPGAHGFGQAVGQGLGNAGQAVGSFLQGVAPVAAPVAQPFVSQEAIVQITNGVASGLKKSIGPSTQILVMSAVVLATTYGIWRFGIKPFSNEITNFIRGCTNHLSKEHDEIQNTVEDVKEITTDTNAVTHRNEVTLESVHAAVIDIRNAVQPKAQRQAQEEVLFLEHAPVDLS
ncbi:hypothetical protein HRU45_01875 [Candidatus Dependentiae bacterium]|nr:hypothetical protein [Candidatus Dependentiae bacterium]